MVVRDCMTPSPVTVDPDTDFKRALGLMQEHAIHHLPVADAKAHVVGIVAERDLLLAALKFQGAAVDVGQVMHRDVVTVRADAPITHAATLMIRHQIGGLPVVDGHDHVVGVITETDIFRAFVAMLEAKSERRAASTTAESASPPRATRATAKKPAPRRR